MDTRHSHYLLSFVEHCTAGSAPSRANWTKNCATKKPQNATNPYAEMARMYEAQELLDQGKKDRRK